MSLNTVSIWNFRAMRWVSRLFLIGSAGAAVIAMHRGETIGAVAAHLFSTFLFLCGHLEVNRVTKVLERRAIRNRSRAKTYA